MVICEFVALISLVRVVLAWESFEVLVDFIDFKEGFWLRFFLLGALLVFGFFLLNAVEKFTNVTDFGALLIHLLVCFTASNFRLIRIIVKLILSSVIIVLDPR